MPVFVRLMCTTGYCKSYWAEVSTWRMCELDMCHIRNEFGGFISVLTHSTAEGRNKILAFGVHQAENAKEWDRFFTFCEVHFPGMTHIISDQDKGLIKIGKKAKERNSTFTASHCVLHMVRNENDARRKAGAGSFSVTNAGGETIQTLATKLAKACTQELYDFFLKKLRLGNKFTADFFDSRKELFSAASFLGQIGNKSKVVSLRGAIPPQARRGKVLSNTAETSNANGGINKYRSLPIVDMVKGILDKMAKQHYLVCVS